MVQRRAPLPPDCPRAVHPWAGCRSPLNKMDAPLPLSTRPPPQTRTHAHARLIFVSNHLPLRASRDEVSGWSFEWDEDALVYHAKVFGVCVGWVVCVRVGG